MDHNDAYRPDLPARIPTPSAATPAAWTPGGGLGEAPPSAFNVRVLLRGVFRHWKLILAIWLVGSAAFVAAVQMKLKPVFEAVATIQVEPAANDLFNNARTREDPDTFLRTQVDLIRSPNVLVAALDSPSVAGLPMVKLSGDAEAELRKKLAVGISPGTILIRVALSSESAPEAAALVNAVVAAYLNSAREWADSTTQKQIRDLGNYLEELKAQEATKQRELTDLADKGNIDVPNVGERPGNGNGAAAAAVPKLAAITIEQYRSVQSNLLANQFELIEAEALLQQRQAEAKANGRREPAAEDVNAVFLNDPEVRQLAGQIKAASDQLELVKGRMSKGYDPTATAAKKKLVELNDQYNFLWDRKEPQIRAQLAASGDNNPQKLLVEARAKVESLQAKKVSFTRTLKEIEVVNRQQGGDTVRASLLNMDLTGLRDMSQSVLRRLESLKFESRGGARITMIHNAQTPKLPVSDLRKKLLAAGPAGLLVGLLGLFALLEVRAGRVTDPDEVSTRVRVRAFALPPLPVPGGPSSRRGRDHAERLAQFIQGVEHLRVALCGDGTGEKGRCIMITSAAGGEGKTTLAAQLAGRCAAAGMSTLLIDCDLRRPSLGELLEVPEGAGLAEVLAGRSSAEDALVVIDSGGGFHLLPAGTPVTDPGRLLQPHRIGPLLERLRRSFDVVIIDTSPVLPVPDALCLGRCVDGAILATRFDASRYPLVERANRRLVEAGIPVLGLVVNGVKSFGSYYNGYGGYAYAHVDPTEVEQA